MSTGVGAELLRDDLKALVRAGRYVSRKEAVEDAVEALLAANLRLRTDVVVELYRAGRVTLSRGAELAGSDLEGFKESVALAGVEISIDESPSEVLTGAATIGRLRATP